METNEKKEPPKEIDGKVRVLSRSEKISYNGITIEGGADPSAKTYRTSDYIDNFHIKNFIIKNDSIISKIILALVVTGVLFFLLFIALPIVLVILGVILTVWIVLSFFQKR